MLSELRTLKNTYRQNLKTEEYELIKKNLPHLARENIISRTLLTQEALKQDNEIPFSEISAEYKKMTDHYGGQDEFIRRFNLTDKDVFRIKENIEKSLKVDYLINSICRHCKVDTIDINSYYENNRESFQAEERVHAWHILAKTSENGSETETINNAVSAIESGMKFEDAAEKFSQCSSAAHKGDLGFVQKNSVPPEMENILFSIAPGKISSVFRTEYGLHICRVTERRAAGTREINEVEEIIETMLLKEMRNKTVKEFLLELRAQAEIKEMAE